jgi:hypothetical protein
MRTGLNRIGPVPGGRLAGLRHLEPMAHFLLHGEGNYAGGRGGA